jgi:outer membrane lipoprotein SlyB
MNKIFLSTSVIMLLIVAACANPGYVPGLSSNTSNCNYTASEALRSSKVTRGMVVGASPVTLEPSGAPAAIGGAAGGAIANSLASKESHLARGLITATGAIGGVIAGGYLTRTKGVQFFVERDNGQTTSVVMQADQCANDIKVGDSVFIVSDPRTGKTRLVR